MHNDSPIKISVVGNPYHRDLIKSTIEPMDGFITLTENRIKSSDLVYWISGPGPGVRNISLLTHQKPRLIVHWIGTDVLNYQSGPRKFHLMIARKLSDFLRKRKGIVHLAGSQWLVDELATAGIEATFLPITSIDIQTMRHENTNRNMSIDFLSYIPRGRFNFYGGDKLINLAESLPRCSFLVIMPDVTDISENADLPVHPENVTFTGKIDFHRMSDIYMRAKCFLRLTEHDGLSLSVLESMFYKLQVFWTYKFPHTIHVEQFEGLQQIMQEVISSWRPNEAGHNYVVKHYSTDAWKGKFREMLLRDACMSLF